MNSFLRFGFFWALSIFLLVPASFAQNVEEQVQRFETQLAQAHADSYHLSAPDAYDDASGYLNDAQKKMKKGDKLSDIRRAVQRGQKRLSDAREFTNIGGVILEDAFAARSAALTVQAPEYAKEHWKDGEKALRSAGGEVENGDQNDAREDAKEATTLYRKAELNAIRVNLLGTAREHRTAARDAKAEKWARQTWRTADEKLQRAEQLLKADRYNRDESRTLAEEATEQFKHARLLARTARMIDDDVKRNAEKVALTYEGHMSKIASALGTTVHFGDGPEAVTERLTAAIQSQTEDRKNLRTALQERRDRIDRLQQMIDSLDTRLASVEEREGNVSAQLQTKRERERMMERARDVFQSEEAEVLTSGNALIVRMMGLNFASGSAEIQPKNFGLLTKLQQVIREFPMGAITISGHTDARGNDATNMRLSEQRSEAVLQYLTANMDLAPERIRALGRGEAEPIASNETEDGRLQNRRIDVKISFQ